MHCRGWKFLKVNYVSVYTFEKCEPEDVVYQIDFQDGKADNDYIQIFKDYGWEYVQGILGMQYFRKSIGIIHKR